MSHLSGSRATYKLFCRYVSRCICCVSSVHSKCLLGCWCW